MRVARVRISCATDQWGSIDAALARMTPNSDMALLISIEKYHLPSPFMRPSARSLRCPELASDCGCKCIDTEDVTRQSHVVPWSFS